MEVMAMPKALSATIPDPLESRARTIAREENRSLSNVVENALGVFTAFPKDLRDQLVARLAAGGPDDPTLRKASRELMFVLARHRYAEARDQLARSLAENLHNIDSEVMSVDDLSPAAETGKT
jgi:hypothetical protein